jgi:hypothetical protein
LAGQHLRDAVFEAQFMLPWLFSEETAAENYMQPQHMAAGDRGAYRTPPHRRGIRAASGRPRQYAHLPRWPLAVSGLPAALGRSWKAFDPELREGGMVYK